MLRPPSEYERAQISLSNRVATIDDLHFDRAIIFFTPKVANKGVDLASLDCKIIQITDRGDWGKEEEQELIIPASSFNNRKYREYILATDSGYSLKIEPPPELRMGILEIFFDPTSNNQSSQYQFMGTNNPSQSIDVNALTASFANALAGNNQAQAEIAANATAAAINNSDKGRKAASKLVTATPWSGDFKNHLIVPANNDRKQSKLFHTGRNGTAVSNSRVNLIVGSLTDKTNLTPDGYLVVDGDFTSNNDEDTLAIYAWVDANKTPVSLSLSESFPL